MTQVLVAVLVTYFDILFVEDDDDDCFFSACEQIHCACVSCDSERVTLAFQSTYSNVWLYNTNNRKNNHKKKKKNVSPSLSLLSLIHI